MWQSLVVAAAIRLGRDYLKQRGGGHDSVCLSVCSVERPKKLKQDVVVVVVVVVVRAGM